MLLVLMGVSGCGKSTVASLLAQALGWTYVEGDAFHSVENVQRMAAGIALNDQDRMGWLQALVQHVNQFTPPANVVLTCSALKQAYRDVLRGAQGPVQFVHLNASPELISARLNLRQGHYMPTSLLQSQFDALQLPQAQEKVWTLDVAQPAADIAQQLVQRLSVTEALT